MLEGWELASASGISSGRPYNVIDAGDDLSGTGEGQDRWTLVGNAQDLWGFGGAARSRATPQQPANLRVRDTRWDFLKRASTQRPQNKWVRKDRLGRRPSTA